VARHRPEEVPHRTHSGEFFGSFGYIAPEQRKDARNATPASDLYAMGVTLYCMLTAKKPCDLSMIDSTPELLDRVHPVFHPLLQQACAYEPHERYPNARAMAEAVAQARDTLAAERGEPPATEAWMREFDAAKGVLEKRPGCLGFLLDRR
jgi:serine/threonine-protein kinase